MSCLGGKGNFEYFLSLLLADLMKRVAANVSQLERAEILLASRFGFNPRPSNLAAMSWPIKLDLILSPFWSGHRHRSSTS
jgi:hypothetical protein